MYFLNFEIFFFLMRWDSFSTNNTLITFFLLLSYLITCALKHMSNQKCIFSWNGESIRQQKILKNKNRPYYILIKYPLENICSDNIYANR